MKGKKNVESKFIEGSLFCVYVLNGNINLYFEMNQADFRFLPYILTGNTQALRCAEYYFSFLLLPTVYNCRFNRGLNSANRLRFLWNQIVY